MFYNLGLKVFVKSNINLIKEVRERKIMSTRLNKYIAAFDCVDQTLLVLPAASSVVSILPLLLPFTCLLE